MENESEQITDLGTLKAFVMPALTLFLIPCVSLTFFLHAQLRFDTLVRTGIQQQIREDESLSPREKADAIAFYRDNPASSLVENELFAAAFPPEERWGYFTFKWMIRLSLLCIASGAGLLVLGVAGVLMARRSPRSLYTVLATGWHTLRIFGAFQAASQIAMLVALSYWVTALRGNVYIPQLIGLVGVFGLIALLGLLKAIFSRPRTEVEFAGELLDVERSAEFWHNLRRICARVETKAPDQIVAGIDDNFFVTESPVLLDGEKIRGRTLYVSLSLLKQLRGTEADAVLAHEMAHFSGKDTVFSRKTATLLTGFEAYLVALNNSLLAQPVFYFMVGFFSLYHALIAEQSRLSEFRADKIASEIATPSDVATALVRIAAYSSYRTSIEKDLFEGSEVLESAKIAEQIEGGFVNYAKSFVDSEEMRGFQTQHPFNTHPPVSDRLKLLGVSLPETALAVAVRGDGRWFDRIDDANALESRQWDEYEKQFLAVHHQSLAFRYLPSNDEERAVVEEEYPEQQLAGKKGIFAIDCCELFHETWEDSISFAHVTSITMFDATLIITHTLGRESLNMNQFKDAAEVLSIVEAYYGRYQAAAAFNQQEQDS